MRWAKRWSSATACAGLILAAGATTSSFASTATPVPATATQVAQLVSASTNIVTLPNDLHPSLTSAPHDTAGHAFRTSASGCATTVQCVYGDTSSTTTVVLYGDSHAQMWLPALAPAAKSLKLRLVLVWHPGCPYVALRTAWAVCDKFRTAAVAAIAKIKPALVLLANKTTNVVGPGGIRFSDAQWQAGTQKTIVALETSLTRVAVVGDLSQMDTSIPPCLATYPTAVQKCGVYNPNPKYTQHFAPEKAAATDTHAGFVATQPWVCRKKCSPVVGNLIVYSDQNHLTATYAAWLTAVWTADLKSLLSIA